MKLLLSRGLLVLGVLSFLLIIFSFDAFGQDLDEATVRGKVVDSNNQAIAGATVSAKLVATGVERTVTTNAEGEYRLIELAPGVYTLKFSATGFGIKERTELALIAAQNVELNITLDPAGVNASTIVTVTGDDAPAVDTTRTIVGGTVTEREIEELPNNGRDPLSLVLTLGGTSEEALSTKDLAEDRNTTYATAPAEQGNFSLSGGTSYSNNITIDGLDNNDDRSANVRFQPSLEAIDEVQVIANQFSAEYGRASGGRINLRTRPGTNTLRGRAFMFFRDDNLNANTWYNNSRSLPRLPLTEYVPGFTLGGPIVIPKIYNGRNKSFFSVAYEYNLTQDTTQIDTFVPLTGNPRFPLPGSNADCRVATCTDANSTPAVTLGAYRNLYDTPSKTHTFSGRFDHNLTANNNFTLGVLIGRKNNQRTAAATTTRLDDALQARITNSDAYNFTDNHVFNGNGVNQFRAQYSIFEPSYQTSNPFDPVILIGYRNPETASSQTLIVGNSTASGGNSETFPQNRRETRLQLQDTISYVFGSHTLKGGFDIQTIKSRAKELADATGTFNFANMGTFQQNTLSRFRLNFGTGSDVKNNYYGFFVNDEMRIANGLTISAGIRYERETSINDKNNFGPRLGIAWDPFKSGKGVIRFGTGMFYNRTLLRTVADSIQNVNGIVPFDTNTIGTTASDTRRLAILAAIAQRFPNSFATEAELHTLVAATCATVVTTFTCNNNTGFVLNSGSTGNPLRSVDASLKIPESYQINFGFEREIGKGFVFEVNYTWNRTIRLWRDRNINAPVLPTGFLDWTDYLRQNSFLLAPGRQYNFYLGSTTDGTGLATTQNGTTACTTTSPICWVNLNTTSTSTTTPAVATAGQNNAATGGPIGIALAAISRFRPDQNFEEKSRIGSIGRAQYNGVVFELRSRYTKFGGGFGGSVRTAYTFASMKDDGLNNTSNAEINGQFEREWARSLQDRRHRLALTGSFDVPKWLGGLRFSPIFRAGSSAPFNLGNGGSDRNLDDLSTDRINYAGLLSDIVWRRPGDPFPEELASRFTLQPIGSSGGNLPRNIGRGPRFYMFDISVTRDFKFTEKVKLRPTIQFDNVFNAAVFNYGAGFIDFNGLGSNASATTIANFRNNFLVPTRTYRQRQIRLGMRFDF